MKGARKIAQAYRLRTGKQDETKTEELLEKNLDHHRARFTSHTHELAKH